MKTRAGQDRTGRRRKKKKSTWGGAIALVSGKKISKTRIWLRRSRGRPVREGGKRGKN